MIDDGEVSLVTETILQHDSPWCVAVKSGYDGRDPFTKSVIGIGACLSGAVIVLILAKGKSKLKLKVDLISFLNINFFLECIISQHFVLAGLHSCRNAEKREIFLNEAKDHLKKFQKLSSKGNRHNNSDVPL